MYSRVLFASLLAGIVFIAHLPSSSPTVLLHSSMALALESMRGVPSLRFISIVKLAEVHYEVVDAITMCVCDRDPVNRTYDLSSVGTFTLALSSHGPFSKTSFVQTRLVKVAVPTTPFVLD